MGLIDGLFAGFEGHSVRAQFWVCPIEGHSEGAWHAGLVQTVVWRDHVAYCLAPGCGRTSVDPEAAVDDGRTVTDDGRTWWLLGADLWPGVHLYCHPSAYSAIAEYRRDLTDAERANGRTVRDVRDWLTAARLHVVAGPMTTVDAYQYDLARAYADELERFKDFTIDVGAEISPLAATDLAARIDRGKAARIRALVRAEYLPAKEKP